MKDHVFSGADVPEALALAAANLGLPLAELRYVVLEPGTPGGRGLSPTPARIAVLLHEEPAPGARPRRPGAPARRRPRREPQDPAPGSARRSAPSPRPAASRSPPRSRTAPRR